MVYNRLGVEIAIILLRQILLAFSRVKLLADVLQRRS